MTIEILSDRGVIPREAIPADADHVAFWRIDFAPGVVVSGANAPQAWAELEYTASGVATIMNTAKVRTWTPNGDVVETPAGQARTLRAGDVFRSYDGGAGVTLANTGGGRGPGPCGPPLPRGRASLAQPDGTLLDHLQLRPAA